MAEKIRTLAMTLAALLCGGLAFAQVDYRPPSGGGTGSADPAQFSSSAGTLTIGGSVGAVTIDADTTVIPTYATGTSLPATCTPFATSFLDTDSTTTLAYDCIGTNTWAGRFTIADDSILVGTGATTASAAIPDCDDTTGQHLNYDTATNAFSCGTSGGSSTFDPSTTLDAYDDFLGGLVGAGTSGTSGMYFLAIATGTATAGLSTAANPGTFRINSHATNDNSGGFLAYIGPNGSTTATGEGPWDAGVWSIDAVVILGSNSTAITSTVFTIGLNQTNNNFHVNGSAGIFIRRDTDLGDTAFIGAVCDSATNGCNSAGAATNQEVVTSTITPSAGTAYRFRISQDFTGPGSTRKISMRVNNETALTFCSSGCTTTISQAPTGVNMVVSITYGTRTTTGVMSADVDYVYLHASGLSRY